MGVGSVARSVRGTEARVRLGEGLRAVEADTWKADGREKQLEFGLKAVEPSLATGPLAHVLQKRKMPRDGSGPWIDLIRTAGDAAALLTLMRTNGKDYATIICAILASS